MVLYREVTTHEVPWNLQYAVECSAFTAFMDNPRFVFKGTAVYTHADRRYIVPIIAERTVGKRTVWLNWYIQVPHEQPALWQPIKLRKCSDHWIGILRVSETVVVKLQVQFYVGFTSPA